MSAGLPGFGLSGAFFIVSALTMVPLEVVRTLRGRSSIERWISVLRSAGIALAMIAALELAYFGLHVALTQLPALISAHRLLNGHARGHTALFRSPLVPVIGTLALVAIVIAGAKAAELISRRRALTRPHPHIEPLTEPVRAL